MTTSMTIYQSILPFKDSNNVALYFLNHKITHREFYKKVNNQAELLYSIGVRKDDVVTILSPNIIECITTFYALNKIGAIVAFLHPLLPKATLEESLIQSKSKFFFVIDVFYKKYEEVVKRVDVKTYLLSAMADISKIEKMVFKHKYKKELEGIDKNMYLHLLNYSLTKEVETNTDYLKPSVYLRSGGTTGKSKIVILNDKQLLYPGSLATWITGQYLPGKAIIGVLPLFHGFGLSMGVIAPLMNNAGSCLMLKFNLKETIKRIKKNQLHVLICIPYLAKKIIDSGKFKGKFLKNLIATYCGADKTPMYIIEQYNKVIDEYGSIGYLLEGYGLTETVTVTFVNTQKNYRIGSVGKPLLGTELRIAEEDNYEEDIGSNKNGMILIASPALCLGYLDGECPFYTDKQGKKWLITGDIGYHDDDGYLFFANRKKEVYKISGMNVFPSQIEEIATSFSEIDFACCLYQDDENHPYLKLFLELNDPSKKDEVIAKLKKEYEDKLIKYACPEKIIVVDNMPRTDVGKIDKNKLMTID